MSCDIITESLIKGIIVTFSRTGITLKEITNVYYECVGENWPMISKGEEHAKRYLEQIEGVLSIVDEKNDLRWYVRGKTLNGRNRGQIYRAHNEPKLDFDLSTNAHGNARNTCTQYTINNNKNNNTSYNNHFRNARNNKGRIDRFYNGHNADINGNFKPRNGKQQKYNTNNRMRVNGNSFGSVSYNNSSGHSTSSSTVHKTSASMYNFDLVGDDFFLELAKIDLGCGFTKRKRIHRSGLCISGQRIRDATERLKRCSCTDNMKIIVNLGTVDILHGRDLSDMCQDYINLVNFCQYRNIKIVITTLPPIANRLHVEADVKKWCDFNEFLIKRFSNKMLVVDIVPTMMCVKTSKVLFDCYQAGAKYMSGTDQPHLLWNRIGRQRILKAIKTSLRF